MFGKRFADYISFQRELLVAIVVIFLVRLGLSLSGLPNSTVRWVSVTTVLWLGFVYTAVKTHKRGFGGYKQIYGLALVASVVTEWLVALAVAMAVITRVDNIYAAPEYFGGGDGKVWLHVILHTFVAGPIGLPLVGWLIGSITLAITRKVSPAPAVAA